MPLITNRNVCIEQLVVPHSMELVNIAV